jgi:hypothetical protein
MPQALFGIVERIHHSTSGPGARLKPLWEASPDRSRWQPLDQEFPNSGLISWWQPPTDLILHSPWYFQIEDAPTYDHSISQHDFFRVRGIPSVPLELLDIAQANDEEELREYLLHTGIPASLCSSKRVVFRQRSGSLLGPIDLAVRDGRYFADEKVLELPISLSQARNDLSLAESSNHRFLPPEEWSVKIGELDFSPTEMFLKRVLRDLKKITPSIVEDVKLTDKLINRYSNAVGTGSLSPSQRHRLMRLKTIAKRSSEDINLPGEALADFLSITTIAELLQDVKKKAADETVASTKASLNTLHEQSMHLEQEISRLNSDIAQRRRDLASLEQQQISALKGFETHAKNRFREISSGASEFLAEIALIRAALNLPTAAPSGDNAVENDIEVHNASEMLNQVEFLERINHCAASNKLSCRTSNALLASMASGFVPIVFGSLARESLSALGRTLASGRLYWLPLNPTLTSSSQVRGEPVIQEQGQLAGANTLDILLQKAMSSPDISILVLENINLAQIDSVLLPFIRQCVELRCASGPYPPRPGRVSTPVGTWPANLLLAGLAIESPLSLPVSTELWSYATFVDASTGRANKQEAAESHNSASVKESQLLYETWTQWINEINGRPATESVIVAAYVGHQIEINSLFERLLTRLASAIDAICAAQESAYRVKLFTELALIPYCLARHHDLRSLLESCPISVPIDTENIARVGSVFKNWGMDII